MPANVFTGSKTFTRGCVSITAIPCKVQMRRDPVIGPEEVYGWEIVKECVSVPAKNPNETLSGYSVTELAADRTHCLVNFTETLAKEALS